MQFDAFSNGRSKKTYMIHFAPPCPIGFITKTLRLIHWRRCVNHLIESIKHLQEILHIGGNVILILQLIALYGGTDAIDETHQIIIGLGAIPLLEVIDVPYSFLGMLLTNAFSYKQNNNNNNN